MNYVSMMLEITGSTEISLQFDGSVSLLFLNIGFSFATLQTFGKNLQDTDRQQRAEIGFARMSAQSFKTFPKVYLLQQF